MFSFFKRKKPENPPAEAPGQAPEEASVADAIVSPGEPSPSESSAAPGPPGTDEQAPAQTGRDADAAPVADPVPVPAAPQKQPVEPAGIEPAPSGPGAPEPLAVQPVARDATPEQPSAVEPVAVESAADAPAGAGSDTPQPASGALPAIAASEAQPEAGEKKSWLSRLRQGLSRTGQSIGGIFVGVKVDEDLFEELETALIMADAGMEATEQLLAALRARVKKERLTDAQAVKAALRDILAEHLAPLEKAFPLGSAKPLVVMIAGVNGAGKTTSIGKLAHAFQGQGASVLLAAADTFRAAAREQLMEWGARNDVTVIAQEGGDPAAVAFDAVNAGRAREASVVMVDTAGRLPTQLHLMEELKKIKRVVAKAEGAAPHEVLLVVDGNTGQNALSQVKAFDAAIGLTGLVVTKLDGTAKGGTLAAMAAGSQGVRPIPVYWIGVGEGMHDLQPFVAREFATALLGD